MTVLETLKWANDKLKSHGIDSPMLDAELLLAFILKTHKARLFSWFNDPVATHREEAFKMLVERRAKHEPIAYIIGEKSFYGKTFIVNPNVLIPRPATETLVEQAIEEAKKSDTDKTLVCDIGTGSGAIAICISAHTGLPIIAVDISQKALNVAIKNKQLNNVENIDFQLGNLMEPIEKIFRTLKAVAQDKFSSVFPFKKLIVCANLPYLSEQQMQNQGLDLTYEPENALKAGADGLDLYWLLFSQIKKHRDILPRNVCVFIEIDPSQTQRAINLITNRFTQAQCVVFKDLSELERVIRADV